MIRIEGLAKRYGPVVALRGADVTVETGEVHGLIGANGAGKSTLVKILSAVFPADSGTITVNGEETMLRKPGDSLSVGIATVFQDPALMPDLTWSILSQYDNRSDNVGFNSRLRWTWRPGNDLFLVWNNAWDYNDGRFDNSTGEAIMKIGTTFRF